MKYLICLAALLWAGMKLTAADNVKEVEIKIIETSDVHGNFFPYNFIERKEWNGSLARVYSYVKEQRKLYGDNCILVDNGDILQGQPTAYYYNFIDTVSRTISTKDAYFGSSPFIDLIHKLQLDISGADISLCAPLSFKAEIPEGEIMVSDMFNLYKYENMLYVMELSGKEIKGFLEMSYAMWTNQMKSADDHLLLFKQPIGEGKRANFEYYSFNFDSAAGINYTVDVTKPRGEKINILSMADGTPFDMDKRYKVALNSYRGNGGGDLLTIGAGIAKEDLSERIVFATDKDLRYYLMQYIEQQKSLHPHAMHQWKFIPEEWTVPAAKRDYKLLFGEDKE